MHATLVRFGYPGTVLLETAHWCVLMRPQQVTLGALVLCAKSEATALPGLPAEAFSELAAVSRHLEAALRLFRPFGKINYLALMMVDPQVHFHVLPRYAATQDYDGTAFPDPGWPGVPDLKQAPALTENVRTGLFASLLDAFRRSG
jgi:diadenosine tetraphosphate (Ap4A) HIT family hydrolase